MLLPQKSLFFFQSFVFKTHRLSNLRRVAAESSESQTSLVVDLEDFLDGHDVGRSAQV